MFITGTSSADKIALDFGGLNSPNTHFSQYPGDGFSLAYIERLTGGKLGVVDTPCPLCSRWRKPQNGHKAVFRLWQREPNFATFNCAHCGAKGYVRDDRPARERDGRLAHARGRERLLAGAGAPEHRADQTRKANWLWRQRQPIVGTIAEAYLREARGIDLGTWPATLGYLPSRDDYPPAMVCAFGVVVEIEPGVLQVDDDRVDAVHLIRLLPDGSGRLPGGEAKIAIGPHKGLPLVVAPMNDLLGLAIAEGVENALSLYAMTGLGAWASGGASFLPALADAVPAYADSIIIAADDDAVGRKGASELAECLRARNLHVDFLNLSGATSA